VAFSMSRKTVLLGFTRCPSNSGPITTNGCSTTSVRIACLIDWLIDSWALGCAYAYVDNDEVERVILRDTPRLLFGESLAVVVWIARERRRLVPIVLGVHSTVVRRV